MALYIQTNVASMIAQSNLAKTQLAQTTSFTRLSSGYRINSASDDGAGLAISDSMTAQIRSFSVAERNANDGISMAQTADGAAAQMTSILQRMRELGVQSSNGGLQTTDRGNINTEFQQLRSELDRISAVTMFNGQQLLSGAQTTIDFQVGINTSTNDKVSVDFGNITTTSLGVGSDAVDTIANAQSAIVNIDLALQSLSTRREGFGAAVNRLQSSVSNIQSMKTNLSAANSRVRDVDIAEETASMAKNQVLAQAGSAILSQANQAPQLAMGLLRG